MWLFLFVAGFVVFLLYRLIQFWILDPWTIHRHLWKQGIPGRYRPIVGDLLLRRKDLLADDPLAYNRRMFSKYGDYYHSSFGPKAQLTISDPFLIENVLKSNAYLYHKAQYEQLILAAILGYENIFVTEGDAHRRHRRLLQPIFQHQNINSMMSLMTEITHRFLRQWTTDINKDSNTSLTIDIYKEISNLTLQIVTGCIFGTEIIEDKHMHETIFENMNIILTEFEKRFFNMLGIIPIINQLPLPGKRRIDQARQNIKQLVEEIINQRKKGLTQSASKGPDLLDLLLTTNGDERTQKFTDEEISSNAVSFILAGHETTSSLIAWALYQLVINPEIYDQCRNEVDSVVNDDNEELNLSLLTYTEAVLKETLRYHQPISTLLRTAIEDNIIVASDGKQIHVKKGTDIVIAVCILHRSEKYWKDPDRFDPSRFNGRYSEKLLAFGSGPRSCIGQNFAILEAKIILALIVKYFQFELVPGQKFVPDVNAAGGPKYGMWMRFSPRSTTE